MCSTVQEFNSLHQLISFYREGWFFAVYTLNTMFENRQQNYVTKKHTEEPVSSSAAFHNKKTDGVSLQALQQLNMQSCSMYIQLKEPIL